MAADKDITILQGSAFNVPVRYMGGVAVSFLSD